MLAGGQQACTPGSKILAFSLACRQIIDDPVEFLSTQNKIWILKTDEPTVFIGSQGSQSLSEGLK